MKKKKSQKKYEAVVIRLYGIFNTKTRKMVKVSLDQTEIDMEFALSGDKELSQCESLVTLLI